MSHSKPRSVSEKSSKAGMKVTIIRRQWKSIGNDQCSIGVPKLSLNQVAKFTISPDYVSFDFDFSAEPQSESLLLGLWRERLPTYNPKEFDLDLRSGAIKNQLDTSVCSSSRLEL